MKSKCCSAEVKIAHSDEGTNWNECVKCESPCDTWEGIVPDGYVVRNYKEYLKDKITFFIYQNKTSASVPICLISPEEKQQFEELKKWYQKIKNLSWQDDDLEVGALLKELDKIMEGE